GFYIGNEICVNVTGPDTSFSSSSSSLSKKFNKGMKMVQKLVDIAGTDRLKNKVRINNCVLIANTLGVSRRSWDKALKMATEGLKIDDNGKILLNEPISYDYNLVKNNCEYFATR